LVLQLLHLLLHDAHLVLQCLSLRVVRKDGAIEGDAGGACRKRHQHRLCQSKFMHCVILMKRVCLNHSRRLPILTSYRPDL
jgi:hypothetical protein